MIFLLRNRTLHSSAAQTSEDRPDSWSPFRSQSTLSQVELHGLQELHFLKQNHDLVARGGGKSGAEPSKAYVTFLFTEVDFLQAFDAGLD
jgi:hypothetical protein